jgi:phage tail-like protein
MRGTVSGMNNPYPLGSLLPAVYQEDDFAMRFTMGLDAVLAPVFSDLACIEAYIDPGTAPSDFLTWLAGWVGMVVEDDWPATHRRQLIARAAELFRMRGTVSGLKEHVAVVTGGHVEVIDNGGVSWSQTPGADFPGEDTPRLAIRVTVDGPMAVHPSSVEALVTAAKPAHVLHRLEVNEQ